MGKLGFVTFVGGWGPSPVERMMAAAYRAIAQDTIETALACRGFDLHILVAEFPETFHLDDDRVIMEAPGRPFHFGRDLIDIVRKHRLEGLCYVGGGALPLLTQKRLVEIVGRLSEGKGVVIANNLYSGDLVAFAPASALERITLPSLDNPLPGLLAREAGLEAAALSKSLETLLDVDTPTDLAVLSLYPGLRPRLKACLDSLKLDTGRLSQALRVFTDERAQLFVAGRVSSFVWSRLEIDTACHCRVMSEERGMRSEGREGAGVVRSFLGQYLEVVGPSRFFQALSEMADAALLDTRVVFRHLHKRLSLADRFLSDLMSPQEISDPWLREFTQAALDAPIPVVLGGHSLVTGDLLALMEVAQLTKDR